MTSFRQRTYVRHLPGQWVSAGRRQILGLTHFSEETFLSRETNFSRIDTFFGEETIFGETDFSAEILL